MSRWRDELDDLVARRGQALVGYAYVVCGNVDDAHDLVQDALVKVFSGLRRPRGPQSTVHAVYPAPAPPTHAEAYVGRAILSLYLDGYRRRGRWTQRRHLLASDDAAPGPASGVSVRADVAAALASLSPQQRACVVLRYFDDLTVSQTADSLGIAEGTVKRHLSDAMARLRPLLAASEPTNPVARPTWRSLDGGLR